MRSPIFTITKVRPSQFLLIMLFALFAYSVSGQSLAVIAPERSGPSSAFAERLADSFPTSIKTLDNSMAAAAYAVAGHGLPFNMTAAEAVNAGAAIGCDVFVMVRAATLRRTSFDRPEYYEAYAATYTVSSRTGRLVYWQLTKNEAPTSAEAEAGLFRMAPSAAAEIAAKIAVARSEPVPTDRTVFSELPIDGTPEAANFRAPVPYRRIKPEYTTTAYLYDVAATVEIQMDLSADGTIVRADVVRWAGFGLDESALAAVRAMKWRPAERSGKTLPVRVLLRYNFKKIDK